MKALVLAGGLTTGLRSLSEHDCIVDYQAEIKNKVQLDRSISICPTDKISKSVLKPRHICRKEEHQ